MVAAPATPRYTGLVTRAIALALDGLLINGIAVLVGTVIALALSALHTGSDVQNVVTAISGVVYILWSAGYFVSFWSTTGQTPGAHVMRFRVQDEATGEILGIGRSIVRLIGVTLATIPLCAGFLPILFDRRRRGLQDWMARTVVTDWEPEVPHVHPPRPSDAA
jgi:uncharacterized RDD family membrane protein YckC